MTYVPLDKIVEMIGNINDNDFITKEYALKFIESLEKIEMDGDTE